MQLILVRWFGAEKIAHEVVPAAAGHVEAFCAVAVMLVGEEEEIEILVGFDECVDDQESVVGRDVVIHGAVGEKEVALQIFGEALVGLVVVVGGAIGIFYQQTLVAFAPVIFVLAIVVVAGFGDSHLDEIGVAKHGGGRGIAATGMAVDAGAIDVNPGIFLGEFFHPSDLIGEGVVFHFAEIEVV